MEHWLQRGPNLDVLRQPTFGSPPSPREWWRSIGSPSRALGTRLTNNNYNSTVVQPFRKERNNPDSALGSAVETVHTACHPIQFPSIVFFKWMAAGPCAVKFPSPGYFFKEIWHVLAGCAMHHFIVIFPPSTLFIIDRTVQKCQQ